MLLFSPDTRPSATAHMGGIVLQQPGADRGSARGSIRDAAATAPPPITIEREPQVEVE